MKELVNNIIECVFEKIHRIKFPQNERFGLITYVNNVKYEFLLNLKESEQILVLGSGARPEHQTTEDKQRPFFNRWSWNFNESMIVYNDPTTYLNEEIRCGWGVGTIDDHYLENISKIILEITNNLGFSNENIIFYGSSVGGFMSLMLSTMIKNSISIAEIPQLDISNYWQVHWERIIKYSFHGLNEEEIKRNYGDRIDVIEKFKKERYVPKSLLIFDCSDGYDLYEHYIPFFRRLMEFPYSDAENNIRIRIDGKNNGHVPSNFDNTSKTISNMINLYFNNSQTYLRTINELNQELHNKNEKYNSDMIKKDEEIDELRKKLQSQEEEINKLKIFREDVLNSNTWKYTESLRNITKKVKSSKKQIMVFNIENLKVSVIIPVYNAEKYLEECLNSVINQTLKEIQIICVVDGSKDESLSILEKFAQMDSRITILTQHNRGPGAARNEALHLAKGEYVAFIDADDQIEEDSLNNLYEYSEGADMILFNAVEHLTGTENKKRVYPVDASDKTFTYKDYKNLVMNSEIIVCSKLHKLNFIKKKNDLEFSNSGLYEDVFFHTKSMIRAKKLKHMDKIFYNYRKTDGNVRQSEYKATNESFILLDIR